MIFINKLLMLKKTTILYGYFLLCAATSFAQTQVKPIAGQTVSINEQGQIDTLTFVSITYSDDMLLQEINPYNMRQNQTTSDVNGFFSIVIPTENHKKSFIVAEMTGYEPLFINMDTLTTNRILLNLVPKTYHITVFFDADTVFWKYNHLKEYMYAKIDPGLLAHGHSKDDFSVDRIETSGERQLFPEPKIGFSELIETVIRNNDIRDSLVIEMIINRHPVEINCIWGKITEAEIRFIESREWESPHHLSPAWLRNSKYVKPIRVVVTIKEL
jgi:hypothetical protein